MGNHISQTELAASAQAEEENATETCESASAIKKKVRRRKPFTISAQMLVLDLQGTLCFLLIIMRF
jgi:hypothetical protein